MSGIENNKDNKKEKGSLRKTTSGTNMVAKSPRRKQLKKKPSLDSSVMQPAEQQRSDLHLSMDFSEIDTKETTKEEKTISARPSKTSLPVKPLPAPEAPPTHYMPVVVQGVWPDFLTYSVLNRNLVFTKVGFCLMSKLMPGDQISTINGIQFWNRESLMEYIAGINQQNPKSPSLMTITVIRVWNMNCMTKEQIEKFVSPQEEHLHYFSVKVYGHTDHGKGWKLVFTKNRVLVQHIYANTPVSTVLMIGDQILGVNDNHFNLKSKRTQRQQALDAIKKSINTKGYAEILGCRLVGARSSPAPSLEAELAEKFPDYAVGVIRGKEAKRRSEKAIVPFEADALEIALRELTFLKQWEKTDENGNIEFELPTCDRGVSLIRNGPAESPVKTAAGPEGANPSIRSASNTQLNKTASSTSVNEKQEKSTGSVYLPITPSAAGEPIADTPRKRKLFPKKDPLEVEQPQECIRFEDVKNETAKITSDIPEEDELKKCDARSGIVAYIKNKWKG